jgi:hypothetical protein
MLPLVAVIKLEQADGTSKIWAGKQPFAYSMANNSNQQNSRLASGRLLVSIAGNLIKATQ